MDKPSAAQREAIRRCPRANDALWLLAVLEDVETELQAEIDAVDAADNELTLARAVVDAAREYINPADSDGEHIFTAREKLKRTIAAYDTAVRAKGESDGGPAFPAEEREPSTMYVGMSLRDWFAGQALPHVTRLWNPEGHAVFMRWTADLLAKRAYEIADAMLAARKKEQGDE